MSKFGKSDFMKMDKMDTAKPAEKKDGGRKGKRTGGRSNKR